MQLIRTRFVVLLRRIDLWTLRGTIRVIASGYEAVTSTLFSIKEGVPQGQAIFIYNK